MHLRELDRSEVIAVGGGVLLALSMFMGWYSLQNRYAYLGTCRGAHSTCSGLTALGPVGYLLLVMAAAPLVLAWVVVRRQSLTWPRGELTAVIALGIPSAVRRVPSSGSTAMSTAGELPSPMCSPL